MAAVEKDAVAAEGKVEGSAPPADGGTTLTRAGVPVPKPRPKPETQVADDGTTPDEPARAEEPHAAPEAPTVIRPAAPRPVERRPTTSRDSFR